MATCFAVSGVDFGGFLGGLIWFCMDGLGVVGGGGGGGFGVGCFFLQLDWLRGSFVYNVACS